MSKASKENGSKNVTRKRSIVSASKTTPDEIGIEKKKITKKHRLYSGVRNNKRTKSSSIGEETSMGEDDGKEHEGSRSGKSNSVHRRNKIWWYQTSKRLPTSANTLKKELCQMFNIMKDAGMLQMDEELENPNKKVRLLPSSSSAKKSRGRTSRATKGGSIVDKFSISKEALKNIHELHTYYMGEVLKTAQGICQNVQKLTVKPDILDLSLIVTNKQMGPKWNMQLIPDNASSLSSDK